MRHKVFFFATRLPALFLVILPLAWIFKYDPCRIISFRVEPEILIAYVSLLAVIVAIFREKIIGLFLPPILIISRAEPPNHFAEVPVKRQDANNPLLATIGIIVKNIGFSNAENVRVLFNGIESNRIHDLDRYLAIPLMISWRDPEIKLEVLPKNLPVRFSIASIANFKPTLFNFQFVMTPNALLQIYCPGNVISKFKFELKAISDNSKAASAIFEIVFSGTYTTDLKINRIK